MRLNHQQANHIHSILRCWYPQRLNTQWAIASITAIEGSSYRKPGAIMLINNNGDSLGMLSGGCLEADVILQAQKAIYLNKNRTLIYDTQDEGAHSPIHFLGCGGSIHIYIQPLNELNQYHQLPRLLNLLNQRKSAAYQISLFAENNNKCIEKTADNPLSNKSKIEADGVITFKYKPLIHLAIFGAGLDAIPMVKMAQVLDWQISLFDYRCTQLSAKQFPSPVSIYKTAFEHLPQLAIDAAIVMGHNIKFDAKALDYLSLSHAQYIGLLGPTHRQKKVLAELKNHFSKPLYGPIGLDIGSELPEEIALSCLAQIQAVLNGKHLGNLPNTKMHSQLEENA